MSDANPSSQGGGYVTAAIGSFLGGVGSYVIMAMVGTSDVSTSAFLTFGRDANLELEGVVIIAALMISTLVAAGGCGLALWQGDHPFAATTGLVTLLLLAPAVIVGTGSDAGPALAAASTLVAALAARWIVLAIGGRARSGAGGGPDPYM